MKTLLKTLSASKLRLFVVVLFVLIFLLNMSLQSCTTRYRTCYGKYTYRPVKTIEQTNHTDKSW